MRSLQLHRRLVLIIAAVGLAIGLAYYFAISPSVIQQGRMLEDAAPSGAYVSTPAEVPEYGAKSGRTRNALVIVAAGLFLGMLAAVVRNKMDRHIYVGSDLEGVLGPGGPRKPSRMVNSGKVSASEPSGAMTRAQGWPPAGAPAVAAMAKKVEASLSAPFFGTQPASSFEPINRQDAGSMNRPEPDSLSTFAVPVAPQVEIQALHAGESQRNADAIAGATEMIGGPTHLEQGRRACVPELHSSESPTGPVPVVQQSLWAQREHLPFAAQPEPSRGGELPTVPAVAIPSEKSLPEGNPDIPLWLSDVQGQRADQPIPLLWQGEEAGQLRSEGSRLEPVPMEFPRLADPALIERGDSAAPQPPSEGSGGAHGYPGPETSQAPAHITEQEGAPERHTSRLSGLRNLLTGLGLKDTHSSAATHDLESAHRTLPVRGGLTAEASTQSSLSRAQSATSSSAAVASVAREVSAQPEFLKPAATVAVYEVEGSKGKKKSSHRASQSSTEFEEATLPSRRGQYRNL